MLTLLKDFRFFCKQIAQYKAAQIKHFFKKNLILNLNSWRQGDTFFKSKNKTVKAKKPQNDLLIFVRLPTKKNICKKCVECWNLRQK